MATGNMIQEAGRSKARLRMNWPITVVILLALSGFAALSCLYIQPGSIIDTLAVFWGQKFLILLNWFPFLCLTGLTYFICKNAFYAGAITCLIGDLLSYVNLVKTEYRNDPFVPGDFGLLKEGVTAVSSFQLDPHWSILAFIFGSILILIILGIFIKSAAPRWPWRLAGSLLLVASFVFAMSTVYLDKTLYSNLEGVDKSNVPLVFQSYGFAYCFLHNYNLYPVDKPDGYSKAEMESWIETTTTDSENIERNDHATAEENLQPNIIFVMCEAFSDISDADVFSYTETENPLYGYHVVANSPQAVSGHLVISNYGAGTANSEFDVLTGIQTNMLSENTSSAFRVVRRNINALPRIYTAAGYNSYFMHPGISWYYNRSSVYRFLGIDDLVFEEAFADQEMTGWRISDAAFLQQLITDIEARTQDSQQPLFAFTVSIENHQSYMYQKYYYEVPKAELNIPVSDEAMEALSVYLHGVRNSSDMLLELTEYLDSFAEPTLLIFFGDHRPTLGQDYSVYRELGLDVGLDTDGASTISTYSVPWLIWGNQAYCQQIDFQEQIAQLDLPAGNLISSNYLGALVYELTGMHGADPYFDYLQSARRCLPVISHGYYMLPDGSYTQVLSEEQEAVFDRLDKWKYYRLRDEALR